MARVGGTAGARAGSTARPGGFAEAVRALHQKAQAKNLARCACARERLSWMLRRSSLARDKGG